MREVGDVIAAAIEGGEPVVLILRGRPVADIVPRRERVHGRPSEQLLADLAEIAALAVRSGVVSDAAHLDDDVGSSEV